MIDSQAKANLFLSQATFGGSESDMSGILNQDAAVFLESEFSKSPTYFMPQILARVGAGGGLAARSHTHITWDTMVEANDQLRQRMVFALSQILVKAQLSTNGSEQIRHIQYQDALVEHAFGNYRDLLEAVTYSPAMAEWLTYMNNQKGDPDTGRMPDENYAREILQLFSIGLVELNPDGTPRLDGQGNPIETYTNDDVVGLARVFTGLSYKGPQFFHNKDDDAYYNPLVMFDDYHSELEKNFLGTTIPENTPGEETIELALDAIFAHPNVGPFISKQLIQRFTSSNPDPEYVERVSTAFDDGSFTSTNGTEFGTGQRGDLEATLAAILLDPSIHDDSIGVTDGKIREPVLRFIHWARAFDVSNIDAANDRLLTDTRDPGEGLGQHPFRSPSVFNFYRPGYVAPGTETGALDLTAPEFQLVNESSAVGYLNFITNFTMQRTSLIDADNPSYVPDYSEEISLAYNESALVDHLDAKLTGGRLSDAEKSEIEDILSGMRARTDSQNNEDEDRTERAHIGAILVMNSPSFAIIY